MHILASFINVRFYLFIIFAEPGMGPSLSLSLDLYVLITYFHLHTQLFTSLLASLLYSVDVWALLTREIYLDSINCEHARLRGNERNLPFCLETNKFPIYLNHEKSTGFRFCIFRISLRSFTLQTFLE